MRALTNGLSALFVRDLRRQARRPAALLMFPGVPTLACCALVFVGLLIRSNLQGMAGVAWAVLLHVPAAFTYLALGGFWADSLIAAERRKGTLAGLMLFPWPRGCRLGGLSLVPAFIGLLMGLAHLPPLLLAVALGQTRMEWVALALLLTPLFTIPTACSGILLPMDLLRSQLRERDGRSSRDLIQRLAILGTASGLVLECSPMIRSSLGAAAFGWFGLPLPLWTPTAVAAILLAAAAAVTAWAELEDETGGLEKGAIRRGGILLASWLAPLGDISTQIALPTWAGVGIMLTILTLAWRLMARVGVARKRVSAGVAPELRWIEDRLPNPMLLRDLRGATQQHSVIEQNLQLCLLGAGLTAACFSMDWMGRRPLGTSAGWFGGLLVALAAALVVFSGVRPLTLWSRERETGSLPLLLSTPLTCRSVLVGRIVASAATTLPGSILLALLGFWLTLTYGALPSPGVLSASLALTPALATFFFAIGAMVKPQRDPPWRWPKDDWFDCILGFQVLATVILAAVLAVRTVNGPTGRGEEIWGAPLFLWNCIIAWATFRLRLYTLERIRSGELELT